MKTRNENDHHPLTIREVQVLREIVNGLPYKAIAVKIGCATETVEKHSQNIRHKLGLHCIADLVRYAFRSGLVTCLLTLSLYAGSPINIGLNWDRSADSNIVAYYQVYWGTNPSTYFDCTNVRHATFWMLPTFPTNRYFFAATAVDSNGMESAFSNEVSADLPHYPDVHCSIESANSPFGPWTVITQFTVTVEMQPTNIFYRSSIQFRK